MSTIVLQANLGNFDKPVGPVEQDITVSFHRFTDNNFPPIEGFTPRLQYRVCKMFGWQMKPDFDYYIWLDGVLALGRSDSAQWLIDQLGDNDIAFFKHPKRDSIAEEVQHLDDYLNRRKGTKRGQDYLIKRYKNGLHKEALKVISQAPQFVDDKLYASTAFIYRNTQDVQDFMTAWGLYQYRYYTCDQVILPFLLWFHRLKVKVLDGTVDKSLYLPRVGSHD